MLCDSTKTLLRSIVDSLKTPEQTGWDGAIEFGNQCLYEMHQMIRPSYQAHKTDRLNTWPSHLPDAAAFARAMPHVKAMMTAIHHKDRTTAIESGNAALAEMNGFGIHGLRGTGKEPRTETGKSSNLVRQHEEPTAKDRPVVKERSSPRRCRVASGN
jgi:hypothetical protein